MMRKLFPILFSLLLMSACVHRPTVVVRSLLEEAEGMMHTCPDTAYFLLQEMGATMDLGTKADSAYHGLLLMEAQVKNGMKLTDTTLLQGLTDYYRTQPDSLMQLRLLRLRALMHRDGGRYNEAVQCYDAAIGEAKRMGEMRWLADMYQELAHLHYSAFLLLPADSLLCIVDSLFCLTEQGAEELKDTTLWIDALCSHYVIPLGKGDYPEAERLLLQGLNLAVYSQKRKAEAFISLYLSGVYEKVGEKEKFFSYIEQFLKYQENVLSKGDYYRALGNAYLRMGKQDSATYYLNKGKELKKKEAFASLSVPMNSVKDDRENSEKPIVRLMEQKKQKEELEWLNIQQNVILLLLIVGLVVFIVYFRKFRKRHQEEEELRKAMEELCESLEEEKERLSERQAQTQELLHAKETQLQEKEGLLKHTIEDLRKEKEEKERLSERQVQTQELLHAKEMQLQEKEGLLKHTIEDLRKEKEELIQKEKTIEVLQLQLDKVASDAIRVLDKIKQIIADFRYKDCSDLKMEETDWQQLQLVLDRRWDGVVTRSSEKYQLSEMELRLFCLNLMGVATAHIQFLLGIGRNGLYEMNHELCDKMGIERTSNTFKKDFKKFIEKGE